MRLGVLSWEKLKIVRLTACHGRIIRLDQLGSRRATQLLIFSSWLSPWRVKKLEKFINFCLKVGHSANLKHSKYRWRQLIVLSEMYKIITSKALGNRGTGTVYDNCRFDIERFRAEPTNYEWCLHPSDTFAYRSAHNNLFLTLRVIHKFKTWKKRCHQMLLQCSFL